MAFYGALMLWISMIYGLYLVGVMTELLPGDEHMPLGAHINGLLGAFGLLDMGWSLSFIRLSERLMSIAVWMTLLGALLQLSAGDAQCNPGGRWPFNLRASSSTTLSLSHGSLWWCSPRWWGLLYGFGGYESEMQVRADR